MEKVVKNFERVEIPLPADGVFKVENLPKLPDEIPSDVGTKGVVLSGRAPIWVYAFLTHYYHPRPWVATYDPRLGGAVVVVSHTSEVKVGEIIKM